MRKVILLVVTILLLSLVLALPAFADDPPPVGGCPANFTLFLDPDDESALPQANGDGYLCQFSVPSPRLIQLVIVDNKLPLS
jgi:hypothetical protein